MKHVVAVFGASRSVPGDHHYDEALRCGRLLGEAGFDVATGGYAGAMEAVAAGATGAGARAIGVTAPEVFATRSGANRQITVERPAPTLVRRIAALVEHTNAAIALWGSIGTAAELLVAWNVAYVSQFSDADRRPVVAVGEPWKTLVPTLVDTLETDPEFVTVVASVDDAVDEIVKRLRKRHPLQGHRAGSSS